jgi:hypothetical protein
MSDYPVVQEPMTTDHSPDPREQLWVEQAQQGDLAAFNFIVERYQKLAYNLALRMLVSGTERYTRCGSPI